MKRLLRNGLMSSVVLFLTGFSTAIASEPVRVAVLDAVLVHATVAMPVTDEEAKRLERFAGELRQALEHSPEHELVDHAELPALINKHVQGVRLERCDSCQAKIARDLGAERILLPWVYKVSELILQMQFDLRDNGKGQIRRRESVHIRGNDDEAWRRGAIALQRKLTNQQSTQ